MVWTINFSEIALKQMQKLDKGVAKKITRYLSEKVAPQEDPKSLGKGLIDDLSGLWRYRIEDYRVVCEIKDSEVIVLVLRVGHRKKIYD